MRSILGGASLLLLPLLDSMIPPSGQGLDKKIKIKKKHFKIPFKKMFVGFKNV